MEYYTAQKLKDAWSKKPCDHPHFRICKLCNIFLRLCNAFRSL